MRPGGALSRIGGSEVCPRAVISESFAAFEVS